MFDDWGDRQMVSGALIRLKSLVDDCARVARAIEREFPRLDPGEQAELADYIRKFLPKFEQAMSAAAREP